MVHAIIFLKCEKGHTLPIGFDNNECGCHSNGKPCIMITCSECLKEHKVSKIRIPLDEEGMKIIKSLLNKDQ